MFNFFKKKEQHPENGLHTVFFKNRKKESEINYKDGMQNGQGTSWHKNGQKAEEAITKNGEVEGNYSSWYDNGQMHEEYSMKDGKFIGHYISWHKNGQVHIEGNYFIPGKENGFWTTWDKKGRIENNEYFVHGFGLYDYDHVVTEKEVLEDLKNLLKGDFGSGIKKGESLRKEYIPLIQMGIDELNKKLGNTKPVE